MLADVIKGRLTELQAEIRDNMNREGENASGNTSKSIRIVEAQGFIALVIGGTSENTAELSTLEKGVSPQDARAQSGLLTSLYNWTIHKGFNVTEPMRIGLAGAIMHNIREYGTIRFSHNVDIYSSARAAAAKDIQTLINGAIGKAIFNAIK